MQVKKVGNSIYLGHLCVKYKTGHYIWTQNDTFFSSHLASIINQTQRKKQT